jgi:hypothetical protein
MAGEQPVTTVEDLDDDAVRAFIMGFVDGLKDREPERGNPSPAAGAVMTTFIWTVGVMLQML